MLEKCWPFNGFWEIFPCMNTIQFLYSLGQGGDWAGVREDNWMKNLFFLLPVIKSSPYYIYKWHVITVVWRAPSDEGGWGMHSAFFPVARPRGADSCGMSTELWDDPQTGQKWALSPAGGKRQRGNDVITMRRLCCDVTTVPKRARLKTRLFRLHLGFLWPPLDNHLFSFFPWLSYWWCHTYSSAKIGHLSSGGFHRYNAKRS